MKILSIYADDERSDSLEEQSFLNFVVVINYIDDDDAGDMFFVSYATYDWMHLHRNLVSKNKKNKINFVSKIDEEEIIDEIRKHVNNCFKAQNVLDCLRKKFKWEYEDMK